MCSQGKSHIFTVLVAIAASQLSLRYLYDPVQLAPTLDSQATGWAQLSVLLHQGRQGCLCCDDGVTLLPESGNVLRITTWMPQDHEKKNVTIPGPDNTKITRELYQSIDITGSEPGDNKMGKTIQTEGKDAFCVQACKPKTGFFY